MAELDDIQRSMEHEEPQFQRYKPKEEYRNESDSGPTSNHTGRAPSQPASSCSPTAEASFTEPASTGERVMNHEWTFEEQFKQVCEVLVDKVAFGSSICYLTSKHLSWIFLHHSLGNLPFSPTTLRLLLWFHVPVNRGRLFDNFHLEFTPDDQLVF